MLISDIAQVHDQAPLALIESRGVLARRVPPYIPDLNPIQNVFPVRSSWLLRLVTCDQYGAWPYYTVSLTLAFITPDMCRGFEKAAVRDYKEYI